MSESSVSLDDDMFKCNCGAVKLMHDIIFLSDRHLQYTKLSTNLSCYTEIIKKLKQQKYMDILVILQDISGYDRESYQTILKEIDFDNAFIRSIIRRLIMRSYVNTNNLKNTIINEKAARYMHMYNDYICYMLERLKRLHFSLDFIDINKDDYSDIIMSNLKNMLSNTKKYFDCDKTHIKSGIYLENGNSYVEAYSRIVGVSNAFIIYIRNYERRNNLLSQIIFQQFNSF